MTPSPANRMAAIAINIMLAIHSFMVCFNNSKVYTQTITQFAENSASSPLGTAMGVDFLCSSLVLAAMLIRSISHRLQSYARPPAIFGSKAGLFADKDSMVLEVS